MKYLPLLVLIFCGTLAYSQKDPVPERKEKDSTQFRKRKTQGGPPATVLTIKDYKIITHARDTTFLDTTLNINKEYAYNFLRRDDFELMPFANVGQPYNYLGRDFNRVSFYPRIGARAKHFNYLEIEDIKYYNVATPMTDLFFKTTFEQGQLLDASLALNTSRRFNVSIAYKGFRSLGKYQHSQSESGNFRTTANYITKDGRYWLRAHIAAQDIISEESGGVADTALQFESENPEFQDRSRIDVVFQDAENKILGKRYFFEHQYALIEKARDSGKTASRALSLGHVLSYETKYYQFRQTNQQDYFGNVFLSPIEDKSNLKTFFNEFNVEVSNKLLGTLRGFGRLYSYDYFFNSILVTSEGEIPNQLKGEEISLGAKYAKRIGEFELEGEGQYTLSGDLTGNMLDASAQYRINDANKVTASLHLSSRMPNLNMLLYQSDYENFNWQNTSTFKNERVNRLKLDLASQVWGNISASFTSIDNYAYFASDASQEDIDAGQENAFVKPKQEDKGVNYIKIKYIKEFKLGKWALNNTVMYQNVSQSNNVLNLPQLVTRNTLYYSNEIFKKAMYLQTGVTFKYFTKYNMDAYNPLLGEFYIQNNQEFGGFPMLDFFINAKIRQTRVYLKAEHFNSSFTGNTFYAAPNYPYRDFVIRFGLVWNFFS
ncbi:putative porin [Muriicola sp. Z0-33]|uniref:putative porin n=1 Tax=Muriicola sp. Z0-33 TaxID=2816957 RepID=UPI0022391064|nr:putative porin [Muriicola sp. Z0-33]MCW5517889.1 putative porin [Muriicola sp. Z0-33]